MIDVSISPRLLLTLESAKKQKNASHYCNNLIACMENDWTVSQLTHFRLNIKKNKIKVLLFGVCLVAHCSFGNK
jgi:hypothetical protein